MSAVRHPHLIAIKHSIETIEMVGEEAVVEKRCHIALFMQSFAGGGAERVMVSLANLLASRDVKVDIVVADIKGPLSSEVSEKVNIVNLAKSSALLSMPALARYIKQECPLTVMSTVDNINFALLLTVALYRLKVKTVVRLANAPSVFKGRDKTFKSRIFRILRHHILRFNNRAGAVVAVSHGVAHDFVKVAGVENTPVSVIYNPVLALPICESAKQPVQNKRLFQDGIPVVIAVGRLEPQKDFSTLVKAFALVADSRSVKLCILGEGSERDALERLAVELGIDDELIMPGFDRNPFKYISRSSVFVLSSLHEGLPNVLIQALALKVPVVSTDCKHGPREILENGKWGVLVEPGDVEGMARAIELQLDDPMPQMPDTELKRYGPDEVVRQYQDLLCYKSSMCSDGEYLSAYCMDCDTQNN